MRGVIFCSGLRRDVFTAGNDINELYAPLTSKERYRQAAAGLGEAGAKAAQQAAAGLPGGTARNAVLCHARARAVVPIQARTVLLCFTYSCRQFWVDSNHFLARLYTSPLVTIAAIRGERKAAAWDNGAAH